MELKLPPMRCSPTRVNDKNTAIMSNRPYWLVPATPHLDYSRDGNGIDARNPIVN